MTAILAWVCLLTGSFVCWQTLVHPSGVSDLAFVFGAFAAIIGLLTLLGVAIDAD